MSFYDATDASLQAAVIKGGGYGRAAGYLLTITGDDRVSVRKSLISEGDIRASVMGGRMADGVYYAVQAWNNGNHELSYTKRNSDMLKREAELKAVTGRFIPLAF